MQLKKGFLLLALAAGTSVFVACKKDKESNENPTCWKCVLTSTYTPDMGMGSTTIDTEVCEQTESQIRALEKQSSTTTSVSMQGVTISQKLVMKCTAK